MVAQVVLTPRKLRSADAKGRTVVVFDVLRATTTMTAALAAGVAQISVFDSIEAARAAAQQFKGPRILCGEQNCLPPPGFDLGNSPRDWNRAAHEGRHVFMATTNGTRAIAAAAELKPAKLLVGSLVNARAVAHAAQTGFRDITLLCAGTAGEPSFEDLLGTGSVLEELAATPCSWAGDAAEMAMRLFSSYERHELPEALHRGAGGQNLVRAGLEADIFYCAKVNSLSVVGQGDDSLTFRAL